MKKKLMLLAVAVLCSVAAFARPGHPGGYRGGWHHRPPYHHHHHPHFYRGWGWGVGGFATGYTLGTMWGRPAWYSPYYVSPVYNHAVYAPPAVRVIANPTPTTTVIYRSW